MNERYIKRLIATIKCGVCGHHYEGENVKILGHRDEFWFLSVFCPVCRSRGFVAAVIKEGMLPQLITDLSEAEKAKFRDLEAVGADDLLDIHNFLKEFDGDFAHLFSRE